MISIDNFLDRLERNLPILIMGWKRDIEMIPLPPDMDDPYSAKVKFKSNDGELVYCFDELSLNLDYKKVIDDLVIIIEDKFAPHKPCISTAAMSKNQVPTNNRTRLPSWKTPVKGEILDMGLINQPL